MMDRPSSEGTIDFRGYRTWYRRVDPPRGERRTPLLLVHGGPGSSSGAYGVFEDLSDRGYPVIRYDQLGCGNSDRPDDPELWHAATFLEEMDALRDQLELDRIHLLGQSWGGMLAMEHAAAHPHDVTAVVLSGAPASVPRLARETRELVEKLPTEIREAIDRHEAAGTTSDPEYAWAVHEFNRRHICRLDPYPESLLDETRLGAQVYATMCGPSEFNITGRLKDWDFTPRLHEIRQPTLVTGGRYDELTPEHATAMVERLPRGRYVRFEHSAHCAFLEETGTYLRTVGDFLDEVEAGAL